MVGACGSDSDTVAPDTTLTVTPAAMETTAAARFEFTSTEADSSFACRLDDAGFAPCTSPQQLMVRDGNRTFEVKAIDAAGNEDPTPAAFSWAVDTGPPTTSIDEAPPALAASASATFVFSADEDASFECALDGAAPEPCESPVTYGDLADGDHGFEVVAIDIFDNRDESAATHAWEIDTIAPVTTLDQAPAALVANAAATFAFSTDDHSATFECRLDGGEFAACASPTTYAGLEDGEHDFEVRAVDPAGNADGDPPSHGWRIDTTPPATSFTGGPTGLTNAPSPSFTFAAGEPATYECSVDGAAFAACTSPHTVTAAAAGQGAHTLSVRATDDAGNVEEAPAQRSWSFDTIAPQTTIASGPPSVVLDGTATFTFTASETATFQCSFDGGAFAACTSPKTYSSLPDGDYTFAVRATDTAGNVDPSPANRAFTTNQAPETTILSGGPPAMTLPYATFTFESNEAAATFECRLNGGSFAPCTSPQSYNDLAYDAHTFEVRAIDDIGTADPTPAELDWSVAPFSYDTLSETGLYADIATQQLAPDVIEFEPTHVLWSDGAVKTRWIRLPPGTQIDTANMDEWEFPVGTQVWKEFRAPDGTLIETRLIERRRSDGNMIGWENYVYATSFQWRLDESDADDNPGAENVNGTNFDIPDLRSCERCHEGRAGFVLGFSAVQLSRDGVADEVTLQSLRADDLLSDPPAAGVDYPLPGNTVEREALGYLHANCGNCHNPSGWAAPLAPDLVLWHDVADTTVTSSNLYTTTVNQPLSAFNSNWDPPPNITLRIDPGNPTDSAIWFRPSVRDPEVPRQDRDQMPLIGTELVSEEGVDALEAWINSL